MRIEPKAIIRQRIRNIKADIKAVRNSGNTYRMRILYAELTSAIIKLNNMTHQEVIMDLLLIIALSLSFWLGLLILQSMASIIHRSDFDRKPFDK